MKSYSPFDKDLSALCASDLAALRISSEGWYIEYKESVGSAASIAKAISAFANTYGGWIFYGIKQFSKEHAIAGSFPGIKRTDVDPILQRIRHAAADFLNPVPHFDSKVIWGPCEELGLEVDLAIICIFVPWSSSTPHVHKGGHIYRRVADGSEPKPENDRFVLDQLWRRSEKLRDYYKDLVADDPEFSQGERDRPYVRLMLIADLWHERNPWIDLSLLDASGIFNQSTGLMTAIPFDTVYTSSNGIIARQVKNNDPNNLTLTWRLYNDLRSEIIIPVPIYRPEDFEDLRAELTEYIFFDRLTQGLGNNYRNSRVVDLNYLFNILTGVVEVQERILDNAQWTSSFYCKAKLLHFWRTIPFIDVLSAWDLFEQYGIPMCLDETVVSPQGTGPETFSEIVRHESIDERRARVLLKALKMFHPIARALGVPSWIDNGTDKQLAYYEELRQAGFRAIDLQRRRNRIDL